MRKLLASGVVLVVGVATAFGSAAADDESFVVTLPVARAAMAEYTVVCDESTPCEQFGGPNVPSGQTDGKRLLVGRESADDANSDDAFVLLAELDLAELPTDAGIASAIVRFQLAAGAPVDLMVHEVIGEWSGSPFSDLPALGDAVGVAEVDGSELIVDVTPIVRSAAGPTVDLALVPTNSSGFGQVFSSTANPSSRRPSVEVEFLTDDQPPTISLTAPAPGVVFGDTQVTVDADDNVGVERVELRVDGELVATSTAAPWSFTLPELPDGPHYLTVRAIDGVGLSAEAGVGVAVRDEWSTPQRLDHDLARGALTPDEYATHAVDFVVGVAPMPNRYASADRPHSLSGWFAGVIALWGELDPVVQDTLEYRLGLSTTPPAGTAAAPLTTSSTATTPVAALAEPFCAGVVTTFPLPDFQEVACLGIYDGFTMLYPAFSVGEFSTEDLDGNGVPDDVDQRAWAIEQSIDYYVDVLGFEPRTGFDVLLLPGRSDALSIPSFTLPGAGLGNVILGADAGNDATPFSEEYLPSHEVFHQLQYNYFSPGDFSWIFNPLSGYNPSSELDSIRWYMEASAEWAAHKWLRSLGADVQTYANDIDAFLDDPQDSLAQVEWLNKNGPQYGAFVVAEHLESIADRALVREVWEEVDAGSDLGKSPHIYASLDRALTARGLGDLGDNTLQMWTALYDLSLPDRVATEDEIDGWRDALALTVATVGDDPPTISSDHRAARVSDRRQDDPPGDAAMLLSDGDVASTGDIRLNSYAGAIVEIQPDEPGVLYLDIELDDNTDVSVRALDAYGGSICAAPVTTKVPDGLEVVVPFAASCHYVAVVFANGSRDGRTVSLGARFGDRPDRTIDNGTIRLGVNDQGHLNVPGFDPSSGTGTSTVGLRYLPTNADALSPGCLCEGWGISAEIFDFVESGWANEYWGGVGNLDTVGADFGDDTAHSVVWIGGPERTLSVEHAYHPVPGVPWLYAIDVEVDNITAVNSDNEFLYYGPLSAVYRRVMDWDVEPTAFSEYVTIGADGGVMPPEIRFTSNDGFGSPDPTDPWSNLGTTGLFDDFGPRDQGAMIEIDLGTLYPSDPAVTFTMYYGAAPDETTALDALAAVGAELYSIAQPDTVDGATTGEPNTFIWGYKAGEGGYEPPVIAIAATAAAEQLTPASVPGLPVQQG